MGLGGFYKNGIVSVEGTRIHVGAKYVQSIRVVLRWTHLQLGETDIKVQVGEEVVRINCRASVFRQYEFECANSMDFIVRRSKICKMNVA